MSTRAPSVRRFMGHARPVALFMMLALVAATSQARESPRASVAGPGIATDSVRVEGAEVNPVERRTSDEAVDRDLGMLDRWQARLDSLQAVRLPYALYRRTLAQACLDFARAEYARSDRCGTLEVVLRHAADLIRGLERGDTSSSIPVLRFQGSDRIRRHWQLAQSTKEGPSFRCVEAEVARLEIELVNAWHEDREGVPCESNKRLETSDVLADDLRRKAEACRPKPAPPPPPPAPLTPAEVRQIKLLPRFVHFALDSASLGATTRGVVDSIARTLIAIPQIKVYMEGHTDRRASVAYNLALSKRRVLAIRDHLLRAGVAAERMEIGYHGKSRPRALGDDVRTFARNRCVIFSYIAPAAVPLKVVPQESDLQIERPGPRKPRRTELQPGRPAPKRKPIPPPRPRGR